MDLKRQKLLALNILLNGVGITKKYQCPSAFKDLIALSDAGALLLEEMKSRLPSETENSLYYGLFLDLYHKEFWIDVEETNVDAIIDLFDQMIFAGELQIPWMFGRDLYDKYYRIFADQKERLNEQETADLLENTPVGVAQVGCLLAGPFGIIETHDSFRPIFPAKTLPLWHCNDTGCERLHYVEFSLKPIPEYLIADEIHNAAVELLGDGVKWGLKFRDTFPHQYNYYDSTSVNDIAALLTSCLSAVELKTLCAQIFMEHSPKIRSYIKMRGPLNALFKNTTTIIVSKMTREQCLQLILCLDDKVILDALEKTIYKRQIIIPSSEKRRPRLGGLGPRGWLGTYSEISQFGFRQLCNGFPDITLALARLRKMVLEFYVDRKIDNGNLMHLLRFSEGESVQQRLDNYINKNNPRQVITDLISIHDKGLVQCIDYLRFGYVPEIQNVDDEKLLVDKILWKLGFAVSGQSNELRVFEKRLDLLLTSSREITNSSEAERERARSAAVNLFVSVEELLDFSLSYCSWLFFSDHFGKTKFRFNMSDGRMTAAKNLSGKKIGGVKLELRKDGKNTLYPLIEGLDLLAKQITILRKKSPKKLIRSEAGEPGYAGRNSLETFPFPHTMFLYDVSENDIGLCAKVLGEVSADLRNGKICDVRNRLEHKREDFPSRSEVEQCCDALSKAIKGLVAAGLYPAEYYRTKTEIDNYGRTTHLFENYSGHRTSVRSFPSQLLSYPPPNDGPIVITPIVHVGDGADIFYADIVSASEYVEMWKDYPKRHEDTLAPQAPVGTADQINAT